MQPRLAARPAARMPGCSPTGARRQTRHRPRSRCGQNVVGPQRALAEASASEKQEEQATYTPVAACQYCPGQADIRLAHIYQQFAFQGGGCRRIPARRVAEKYCDAEYDAMRVLVQRASEREWLGTAGEVNGMPVAIVTSSYY